MDILPDVDFKTLVFGAAIAAGFIIFGFTYWDWFYPFASMGLLYAGYGQKNVKIGTLCGAFASTPIIVLAFQGYLGRFEGFFVTDTGILTLAILILVVGAFVGFVGAWSKRSREKAIEEQKKNQKKGKNKKKKPKAERNKSN